MKTNYILLQMTRYKQAEFEDEDSSSVGSVQLTEGVSATSTHIRYHSGATLWKTRSLLEKCLLLITAILLLVVFIMGTLLSVTVRNENAMQVLHVGPHTAGVKEYRESLSTRLYPACNSGGNEDGLHDVR
uniref:Uncharacterized protein n=1 Tax=Timema cristinae TaxID=61476 RepID=A0A7R9DE30_TIMCR|nr:unnamed protein product [Timema cristinae]